MNEFDEADWDDYLLDRADEYLLAREDWLELHGEPLVCPSLEEAIRQAGLAKKRAALATELILAEEMDDG